MLTPKNPSVRDNKFRMFIGAQPCMKCKIEGCSQAAHLERGGMGYKGNDNTCAPLCHEGANSCHKGLDQFLDAHYWHENLDRAIANQKQVYALWKNGETEQAQILMRLF